jgi:DNA-binding GntR family transcriptional regulator
MPSTTRNTTASSRSSKSASNIETLTDRAYTEIEELIVTLQLAPGSVLSEQMLSERLGIGRTPIREALQRLAREGLARRAADAERARFAELARGFERAARTGDDKAFMRIDREFNELCLAAVRNEFAAGTMRLMNSLSRRFWFHHYKQAADMPETAKLHADIARAIAAGEGKGAAAALDRLLDSIEEFTRATVDADA